MPELYETFIHLTFIGIIALFPVVNPIGSAFMVSPYFENLTNGNPRADYLRIAGGEAMQVSARPVLTVTFQP